MTILVLGGTRFLGRHIVDAARSRRHRVVLFNRGRTNPGLFPDIEALQGNREDDVSALRGRTFEAVIDCSGYRPDEVRRVTEVLRGDIAHYTFVSTISVYRAFPPHRTFDENAALDEGDQGYGALKARCEEALQQTLAGRLACVRPGLIVGPHDPTDRFAYWPRRVARGGEVLAPGRPERAIQLIDVRDLAEWCVLLAEHRSAGVFNAVGPQSVLTMSQLLKECVSVTGSDARFLWVPDDKLLAAGVTPWTELPLWIPESDPQFGGMLMGENRRALAAGLSFRPLADTIRATLDWERREGMRPNDSSNRPKPLSPERETELLSLHTN